MASALSFSVTSPTLPPAASKPLFQRYREGVGAPPDLRKTGLGPSKIAVCCKIRLRLPPLPRPILELEWANGNPLQGLSKNVHSRKPLGMRKNVRSGKPLGMSKNVRSGKPLGMCKNVRGGNPPGMSKNVHSGKPL